MAASMKIVLGARTPCLKSLCRHECITVARNASWTSFFRGSKSEDEEPKKVKPRKHNPADGPTTLSRLESLKKKVSVYSVRGYKPPDNVEGTVVAVAASVLGQAVEPSFKLDDRVVKFKVLTRLMEEFDHPIPNTELSTMNTLEGAIMFFSTPVRDKSTYEDLAKLNLPKNLHIQLEPVRFDPETDTFFDGQSAFPGRPTVVTSLKYRRKYKGHSGESRNQRSMTNFELQKELQEDYERLGWKLK